MLEKSGLKEVEIEKVEIDDHFWNPRLENNRNNTLRHQYDQLEKNGIIDNFKTAAGEKTENYNGVFFGDSDIYKWLEAVCYSLIHNFDEDLMDRVNEIVRVIIAAQQDDGYLNTYFIVVEPDRKWTNLGMMHELYCAGHFFQAAVAHYNLTLEKTLLRAACKYADLIDNYFRQSGRSGIPGHEEIELGLVELYRVTANTNYLKLAMFFINNRGQEDSPFKKELDNLEQIAGSNFEIDIENYNKVKFKELYRRFFMDENGEYDGSYAQDHLPVREQKEVTGHAVRAMYLYSAMTDLAAEIEDRALEKALFALWENMTKKRMYITGSIGSSKENEGFTEDYDLSNLDGYGETCAAVGSIMWNHRLLKLTGEAKYGNILERVLYNGFLAGVSLDGRCFFYDNHLASNGQFKRQGWFTVSCCPPNAARLLATLNRYIYLTGSDELYVNLYISGRLSSVIIGDSIVSITQSTEYPWNGESTFRVKTDKLSRFKLKLRIPDWCNNFKIELNNEIYNYKVEKGFAVIDKIWQGEEMVRLIFEMPIRKNISHPAIKENLGKAAIMRGPLVYCLEEEDNKFDIDYFMLPSNNLLEVNHREDILGGITVIEGQGLFPDFSGWEGNIYRPENEAQYTNVTFRAIPYYSWAHRSNGLMRVWLRLI